MNLSSVHLIITYNIKVSQILLQRMELGMNIVIMKKTFALNRLGTQTRITLTRLKVIYPNIRQEDSEVSNKTFIKKIQKSLIMTATMMKMRMIIDL